MVSGIHAARVVAALWLQSSWAVYAPGARVGVLRRRLFLGAVTGAAVSAGLTLWVLRRAPVDDPDMRLIVLGATIVPVALAGCLLGCIAEFALLRRPRFRSWLGSQPVDRRLARILNRAPSLTLLTAASLVFAAPCYLLVHRSLGGPVRDSILITAFSLLVGPATAPILVRGAQRTVLFLRIGSAYGGALIAFWLRATRIMAALWLQSLWAVYAPGARVGVLRRRLFLGAVTGAAVSAGLTLWVLRRDPVDDPDMRLIVLGATIVSVALAGCLLGCIAEFALTERPRFSSWLRSQPVDRRLARILSRAPSLTLLTAASLVFAVPFYLLVHRSLGGPVRDSILITAFSLLVGPATAPILVRGAQRTVLFLRIGSAYGGALIAFWLLWAALSGLTLKTIFSHGADGGLPCGSYLLGWPAVVDASLFGGSIWVSATVVPVLSVVGLVSMARLQSFAEVGQSSRPRHSFSFRLAPLAVNGVVRSWRHRRTRAHLIAGIVFLAAYCGWDANSGTDVPGETAAMILALFLAGYATAKRGLTGRRMLEVRLLTTPGRQGAAHLWGTWLVTISLAGLGGLALALIDDRPELLLVSVSMTWFAVNFGLFCGASFVPEPGDATSETLTSFGVLGALGGTGNVVDTWFGDSLTPYLSTLGIAGLIFAFVAFRIDLWRWSTIVRSSRKGK